MRTVWKVLLVVVVLGAAALLFYKNSSSLDPASATIYATPTQWLCTDRACGHEFTMTLGEARRREQSIKSEYLDCPKCGKSTVVRGLACPFCNRVSPPDEMGRLQAVCPKCGKRNHADPHEERFGMPAHSGEGEEK